MISRRATSSDMKGVPEPGAASVPSRHDIQTAVAVTATAPFSGLGPDTVLDAIDAAGFRCDGRSLALNSYENRVYQAGLEDGSWVVAKFYRPGRWSDEAILEEIKGSLRAGDSVILRRFGTFDVRVKAARSGRNPKTGESAAISARRVVRFRSGQRLKAAVNESVEVG